MNAGGDCRLEVVVLNCGEGKCLYYFNATGWKACLLINFGSPRVEIKRLLNH
jgi:hypothetical protein